MLSPARRVTACLLAALTLVPAPTGHAQTPQPAAVEEGCVPIDLLAALRLAATGNLDIAQAREIVNQARAGRLRARSLALPNINLGSAYVDHEGQIQRTEGNIITVNRDSLFVGGGPSLSLQTSEALFAPLLARQVE